MRKLTSNIRLRHAVIATLVAFVVGLVTLLRPLDIGVWTTQSKFFDHSASGDIVFVEMDGSKFPSNSEQNDQLAEVLGRLADSNAETIVVDLPIKLSRSDRTNDDLRSVLQANRNRVLLTRTVRSDFHDSETYSETDPFFTRGMPQVSRDYQTDFLGFVWDIGARQSWDGAELESLSFAIAGEDTSRSFVLPDYTIDPATIPRISALDLKRIPATDLRGKTVVIGEAGPNSVLVKVPDAGIVPSSVIHIIGAETLKRGTGYTAPWIVFALFAIALIAGAAKFKKDRARRLFYCSWVAALLVVFVLSAKFGIRITFSEPALLGAWYAMLRAIARYKRRHVYIDNRTKLPNFAALQRDVENGDHGPSHAIVVAKIARLDAMFANLPQGERAGYLRQIASRLALGDSGTAIYYDGGKYFAFALKKTPDLDLQAHLEGLRAVASQSIATGDRALDVSLTFGADEGTGKPIASRLSSAIAAADQAREAYRPVFVISELEENGDTWDYSLQARLETALSEDRISIKLQPQVDLRTGMIEGAEALARWVDEERGEISPARFILQCERAGRLDELTKRVVLKSLRAASMLGEHGHQPKISINVSAIQFVDNRIADLFEENLRKFEVDPASLAIEVTETARIEDFRSARDVFEEIRRTGIRFSMDDFGVESANLEALFELPFDEIKIDQMFVRQLASSSRARAIVSNVVRMAEESEMHSVAEGIEDAESYRLLREMGCRTGQGFYISRPLHLVEFREILVLQNDSLRPKIQQG